MSPSFSGCPGKEAGFRSLQLSQWPLVWLTPISPRLAKHDFCLVLSFHICSRGGLQLPTSVPHTAVRSHGLGKLTSKKAEDGL